MASNNYVEDPQYYWATPGKIIVDGLNRSGTTLDEFRNYFGNFGEPIDSFLVTNESGECRGVGTVTYADPSVVDSLLAQTHKIRGRKIVMERAPKLLPEFRDFKTKIIRLQGLPESLTEDELRNFFSQYGEVVDQDIIRNHPDNSGFIVFDHERVVDDILKNGNNTIDMGGTQVAIERA